MKLTEVFSTAGSALNRNGTDRRTKYRRLRLTHRAVEQFEVRQLLSATPFQDDHVDRPGPDATMVTIDPQNSSLRLDGHIEHINDADVFRFSLPEAAVLTFDFGDSESGYVPSLELLNSDGISIDYTSNGAQFIVPADSWYLSVSGNPGFRSGDYSIAVLINQPGYVLPPDDHVDNWGPEATHVLVDASTSTLTLEGFMNHVNDRDFFQFDLEVPTRMSFQWSMPDGAFRGSITIYDIFGQEVTSYHPWSLNFSDGVSLEAGRWFIMISSNPGFQNGDYIVTALLEELPDSPSPETEPNWPCPCDDPPDPVINDYPTDDIEATPAITWIDIQNLDGPWPEHDVDWILIPVDDPTTIAWQSVLEAMTCEVPVHPTDSQQPTNGSDSPSESEVTLPIDVPPTELPEGLNQPSTPMPGLTPDELWIDQVNDVGNAIQTRIPDQERIVDSSFILPEQSGPYRNWMRALRNGVGNSDRSRWSAVIESPLTSMRLQPDSSAMSLDIFWNNSDRRELTSLLDV